MTHNAHDDFCEDEEEYVEGKEDEESEVDVGGDGGDALEQGVVEDEDFGEPEKGNDDGGEDEEATDEPFGAVPVLAAGPEFGGDGEDEVGSEDEGPPGPAGAQNLLVVVKGAPEGVAGGDPVEEEEHGDATEEGGNGAQSVSNVGHQAALRADVLHLS